jgi:poly(beta-D-mannuronate) C5 epimerase
LNHKHYGQYIHHHQDISTNFRGYTIGKINNLHATPDQKTNNPDLSYFENQELEPNWAILPEGKVSIEKLHKGYKKLRSQIAEFGERQERLDPLSIVIETGVYNLNKLTEVVNDASLLKKQSYDIYLLSVPLIVKPTAKLYIQAGDKFLLSSDKGALISNFGDLYVNDAVVKGWNVEENKPAFYKGAKKFRPYLVSWCGANLDIRNSDISYLGYDQSKSYGITYTSCTDTLYEEDYSGFPGSTGKIINSKIKDIYFGFYSYEAENIAIIGNHFDKNIVYGIDPHDRSKKLMIANNTVTGTREKHGIILSRDVTDSTIINNLIEGNAGSGIMLDRHSTRNNVSGNTVKNNGGDGISIYESPDNFLKNNKFFDNQSNGIRVRNSWNVVSLSDALHSNKAGAMQLYTDDLNDRDTAIDPYKKRAGIELISTELVNHPESTFKLENFNRFVLRQPKIFKSGEKLFKGDLKGIEKHISDALYDNGSVIIEKQN